MFSATSRRRGLVASAALALLATPLALVAPAQAASSGLIITEVYGAGGNTGADLNADYVELRNLSTSPISLDGLSLQYRSSGGGGAANGVAPLTGTVPAGEHFLVQTSAEGDPDGAELGRADLVFENGVNMAGSNGTVWVASTTSPMTLPTGSVVNAANVVDLVGFGSTNTFESSPTAALTTTMSARRTDESVDGDNNGADFAVGDQTPTACATCEEEPPPGEGDYTIAQIQGSGTASPVAGETATTRGVVTAAYPTGDFYAFVIQTEGTGAGDDATPGASDALWVYQASGGVDAEIGQFVEVTGTVSERFGRTQLTYDPEAGPLEVLDESFDPVTPLATDWWASATEREAHESELLDVSGVGFTVSNNYSTNRFGEIGLATGDRPLVTPTEVANPNLDQPGYQAAVEENFVRGVVLDDGADWDYLNDEFSWDDAVPWIDRDTTARVGASADLTAPVILDYAFGDWRFQPTSQVIGAQPALASFGDTRPENAAPQPVGGDITVATFNVLNYFNTTGEDFVAAGGSCSYFTDRAGEEVTTDQCTPDGPRGAADDADLGRQQAKIVTALNTLDASVVALEEIENSVKLGEPRDDALAALTQALNADAGSQRWAYAPSPAAEDLPAVEDQDVIRTAFIYDPSAVELVGGSQVLVGSPAFGNARQPLAQAFQPVGTTDQDAFAVVVNHFKSKGSACAGEPNGPQGNCNESRIRQARALDGFADEFAAERGLEQVFLTGDFNSYSQEDPMVLLKTLGWTNLPSDTADEWSYSFDGMAGSLDHVLANDAALREVTGVDVWEINANEALAFEYSRFNYNVTQFYEPNVFRASDHNPELVGIDVRDASDVSLELSPTQVKRKRGVSTATVTVTGTDDGATGTVRFLVDGTVIGQRALLDGTASIPVGPFDEKGDYTVTVEYVGDDDNLPGTDSATLRVGN